MWINSLGVNKLKRFDWIKLVHRLGINLVTTIFETSVLWNDVYGNESFRPPSRSVSSEKDSHPESE